MAIFHSKLLVYHRVSLLHLSLDWHSSGEIPKAWWPRWERGMALNNAPVSAKLAEGNQVNSTWLTGLMVGLC